ncbi:MAG: helix-turn-helix domain-containing protein [Chloroflexi bacterium]|nr:helix-turn-helix domain-containing protein [Chloroflexota bacterium]
MTRRKGMPLIDALPEYYPYRDNGCEVSPSCLACPLPKCRYDDPGWIQREAREKRDGEVLKVRHRDRKTVHQLAKEFGISQRTVHRILSRAGNGNGTNVFRS